VKIFEDYFSELQTDMVSICLEYVDNKADDVYIYCSYEPEMYEFNVFYKIKGKLIQKHQLNEVEENQNDKHVYDISDERQDALLDIGLKDLQEIHKKCIEYNKAMPTEMKLHYSVHDNKLRGKYRYDLIYSNDEDLLPMNIFMQWFDDLKKGINE
jgi:hypothetical protein